MPDDASSTPILDDLPADRDALDFGPYIATLADIVASPTTRTPLTIGVFGTWGSGKTSLLRMVRARLPKSFRVAWFDVWKREGGPGDTTPVGQYSPAGDSPYNAADMSGNVWEWTNSKPDKYPYNANDGREDGQGDSFVLRGGAWFSDEVYARAACRAVPPRDFTWGYSGFRVASASPVSRL